MLGKEGRISVLNPPLPQQGISADVLKGTKQANADMEGKSFFSTGAFFFWRRSDSLIR